MVRFSVSLLILISLALDTAGQPATVTKDRIDLLVDRDGNRYPVKKLTDACLWMSANLKVNIEGSNCYQGENANCKRYGRLYTWKAAKEACELFGNGWHLPSEQEWFEPGTKFGGVHGDSSNSGKAAYKALLQGGVSDFDVVLGGNTEADGKFARLEQHGFYWTATQSVPDYAWFYNFGKGAGLMNRHSDGELTSGFSVRCVKSLK